MTGVCWRLFERKQTAPVCGPVCHLLLSHMEATAAAAATTIESERRPRTSNIQLSFCFFYSTLTVKSIEKLYQANDGGAAQRDGAPRDGHEGVKLSPMIFPIVICSRSKPFRGRTDGRTSPFRSGCHYITGVRILNSSFGISQRALGQMKNNC